FGCLHCVARAQGGGTHPESVGPPARRTVRLAATGGGRREVLAERRSDASTCLQTAVHRGTIDCRDLRVVISGGHTIWQLDRRFWIHDPATDYRYQRRPAGDS